MQRSLNAALDLWLENKALHTRDFVLAAVLRLAPITGAPLDGVLAALPQAPRVLEPDIGPRRARRMWRHVAWQEPCGEATTRALARLRNTARAASSAHPNAVAAGVGTSPGLVGGGPGPVLVLDECRTEADALLLAVQVRHRDTLAFGGDTLQ